MLYIVYVFFLPSKKPTYYEKGTYYTYIISSIYFKRNNLKKFVFAQYIVQCTITDLNIYLGINAICKSTCKVVKITLIYCISFVALWWRGEVIKHYDDPRSERDTTKNDFQ